MKTENCHITEISWEVCNKVGGIYTVLSSRAGEMIRRHGADNLLFIGPLLESSAARDDFRPGRFDASLPSEICVRGISLPVQQGCWLTPQGEAHAVLTDYRPLRQIKSDLYYQMWEAYGIESDKGYDDYDDSCLFAIAAAAIALQVSEQLPQTVCPITIYNEWTTGMGLLYQKLQNPNLKTLFITHATTVGRSICSNGKDLYTYFSGYRGDQMAGELHVEAKHALEQKAAREATQFATVSEVTAMECTQLLGRTPRVLPNGFILPADDASRREAARDRLLSAASALYGRRFDRNTLVAATSGRYEFRNKGTDLIVRALQSTACGTAHKDLVFFFFIPAWTAQARLDLAYLTERSETPPAPLAYPYLTHWLYNRQEDVLCSCIDALIRSGCTERGVYPIFVPTYLDGRDGIVNLPYYDLVRAADLTLFPSYYEPWGYTPLESLAYGTPTVTTDLAGFGRAMISLLGDTVKERMHRGVRVIPRRNEPEDYVVRQLAETIELFLHMPEKSLPEMRSAARDSASHATWGDFYDHYVAAYEAMAAEGEKN